MSAATPHGSQPYYFVPAPSRHPAMVALGLFLVILGAGQWVNGTGWAKWKVRRLSEERPTSLSSTD